MELHEDSCVIVIKGGRYP